MEALCSASGGRLYGLGLLPVRDPEAAAAELERIARLPHLRGAVIGTTGAGKGLDDRRSIRYGRRRSGRER